MSEADKQEKINRQKKIAEKVGELSKPLLQDLKNNHLNGSYTGIETCNGAKIIQQHHFTPHGFDFKIN